MNTLGRQTLHCLSAEHCIKEECIVFFNTKCVLTPLISFSEMHLSATQEDPLPTSVLFDHGGVKYARVSRGRAGTRQMSQTASERRCALKALANRTQHPRPLEKLEI